MAESYYGLAVGGPADGEQLVSRSIFHRVVVMPERWLAPLAEEVVRPPDIKIVEYRWREGRWFVDAK